MEMNIKVSTLLEILKKNRDGHETEFELAMEGYSKKCRQWLEKELDNLKRDRPVSMHFMLSAPSDHTDDYNTVIGMLEHTTDEIISLGHKEYRQYVEDDWNWRKDWLLSNTQYMK